MSECYIPSNLEELGRDLGHMTADSVILAGGTDLVLHLRNKHLEPDLFVSLCCVRELAGITITEDKAVIGAMATMTQVAAATDGYEDLQCISDAAGGVGSPQIRNKGTIGGNVANASPAGDLPPVLWMLNAQVDLMAAGGARRSMPLREFFQGIGKTALGPNEVLVSFTIDRRALAGWKTAFVKLGHRSQVTISRIGMAMGMKLNAEGLVEDTCIVAGAIQPIPYEMVDAENILRGRRPDPALAEEMGDTIVGHTRRAYKAAACKGVMEDALLRFQS